MVACQTQEPLMVDLVVMEEPRMVDLFMEEYLMVELAMGEPLTVFMMVLLMKEVTI